MSREAFGLKPTKESITNDILNVIISAGFNGVCRQVLLNYDPALEKWGYNIYNNNYDYLAKRSKWFGENFVKNNYGSVVFGTRDCSCGNGHCKNVYLKARQFDPVLDNGVKIKGLITTDPRILKLFRSDQKFINKQLKAEFKNKENLDYQLINEIVALKEQQERLEDIGEA